MIKVKKQEDDLAFDLARQELDRQVVSKQRALEDLTKQLGRQQSDLHTLRASTRASQSVSLTPK